MGIFDEEDICSDLTLSWEKEFTILGIDIDNKLKKLNKNFDRIYNDTRGIIGLHPRKKMTIDG